MHCSGARNNTNLQGKNKVYCGNLIIGEFMEIPGGPPAVNRDDLILSPDSRVHK